MKTRRSGTKLNLMIGALGLAAWGALAQMPGSGAPGGMSATLLKLFGDTKAFSAKAEVQVLDEAKQEMIKTPMDFALLDNKIRIDIDVTQMKNRDVLSGVLNTLKQMRMARTISIIRPDKNLVYVIYPGQKVMLSAPFATEAAAIRKKTELGDETVDGHPCKKCQVTLTGPRGQSAQAITWNATDLHGLPIQIQTQEGKSTSFIRFHQVQLAKPDPGLFEPPTGYALYYDANKLMQDILDKTAAASAAPGPARPKPQP